MIITEYGGRPRPDTLDYIAVREGALRLPAGSGHINMRDPFAQPRFLPLHQSGEWWIEVNQYPEAPHSPGEFSLARRSVAGDSIWSKTFSQEPTDIPATSVDQIVDSMIEASRRAIAETELRDALRPPAYYYAVDRAMVSMSETSGSASGMGMVVRGWSWIVMASPSPS